MGGGRNASTRVGGTLCEISTVNTNWFIIISNAKGRARTAIPCSLQLKDALAECRVPLGDDGSTYIKMHKSTQKIIMEEEGIGGTCGRHLPRPSDYAQTYA